MDEKRLSWDFNILKRAQLSSVSGSVTIKMDNGLIVGCKTEHNEKPILDEKIKSF